MTALQGTIIYGSRALHMVQTHPNPTFSAPAQGRPPSPQQPCQASRSLRLISGMPENQGLPSSPNLPVRPPKWELAAVSQVEIYQTIK